MNDDYIKYDGRTPEPPYTTEDERRMELEDIIEELKEQLTLAANNTAAADLAQEVEFMRTKMQTASQAFAEWESVRTFRNDINSHEWLALVAAMTGLEHEQH